MASCWEPWQVVGRFLETHRASCPGPCSWGAPGKALGALGRHHGELLGATHRTFPSASGLSFWVGSREGLWEPWESPWRAAGIHRSSSGSFLEALAEQAGWAKLMGCTGGGPGSLGKAPWRAAGSHRASSRAIPGDSWEKLGKPLEISLMFLVRPLGIVVCLKGPSASPHPALHEL